MKRNPQHLAQILAIVGPGIFGFAPSFVKAQTKSARPAYESMTQASAVKMGLDRFIVVYSQRPGGESTHGQVAGYDYYARSKHATNNVRAQKLSATQRAQINAIRSNLAQMGQAAWTMGFLAAGGGTVWSQSAAAARAEREDFLGRLIAAWPHNYSGRIEAARSQRQDFERKIEADLKYLKAQKSKVDGVDEMSRAQSQKKYVENWAQASRAWKQLRRLMPLLPDTTSRAVAGNAWREIRFAAQEAS